MEFIFHAGGYHLEQESREQGSAGVIESVRRPTDLPMPENDILIYSTEYSVMNYHSRVKAWFTEDYFDHHVLE